jgi:outer membrane protein
MRVVMIGTALALSVAAQAALAQAGTPEKSLAECIAIALQQQPSLKAAAALVQAGNQRVLQATANYLPQVSALYTADRRSTSPGNRTGTAVAAPSQTFNFYNTGVNFTQVLFDFGQTLAAIHSAQASELSLQADQANQRETVLFNVRQSYFNVLAARRLLGVADETVRQNQQHVEQAQGRFNVGLAAKFDVTQTQVQLAQAELNQITARNNVAVARETLRNALGLTGPLDFGIIDTFDIREVHITEAEALTLAYDNRPDLRSIRFQEVAANEQIVSLQKNYLPILTGQGSYAWSGTDYPLQDNWDIGAAVRLSIFNGGLTTAQVGEQKANLANLKFNEEVLRQNIALEVSQATLDLQRAAESIRVAEKGQQQARENLDLAEGRYNTGVGSIIELTDAQASLTTAEANYVAALYTYKTSVAALEKATAKQLAPD